MDFFKLVPFLLVLLTNYVLSRPVGQEPQLLLPTIPGYVPVFIQHGDVPPDVESLYQEIRRQQSAKGGDGAFAVLIEQGAVRSGSLPLESKSGDDDKHVAIKADKPEKKVVDKPEKKVSEKPTKPAKDTSSSSAPAS